MDKVKKFKEIISEMSKIYEKKSHDYNDSFGQSIKEFGPVSGIVRISDKFNRLKSLLIDKNKQEVNDESVIDTLTDMANYCIMLRIELEKEPNLSTFDIKLTKNSDVLSLYRYLKDLDKTSITDPITINGIKERYTVTISDSRKNAIEFLKANKA